jgi:hypothetical protein
VKPGAITVLGLMWIISCGYSTSIEGLYRTSPSVDPGSGSQAFYLELVASQYGPEVGGLAHLYSDNRFKVPFGDSRKGCSCVPVENATVEDGIFSFIFILPGGCLEQDSDMVFLGSGFEADSEVMQGHIKWRDKKGSDWHILPGLFTLKREKILKELTIEDKKCQ